MGWLKRKFALWSRDAWANTDQSMEYDIPCTRAGINSKSSIRFTIHAAQGGHVIEYYTLGGYEESDGHELVIVDSDQGIGQSVEHILTMESLKK